ncbi:MAG: endolytic transglycosylase MltG [candidate division WOR-3 bacterium]
MLDKKSKPINERFGYWSLPIGFLLATILFAGITVLANWLRSPNQIHQFILYKNEPVRITAFRLKEAGIIDNPIRFILFAKLFGYERKLKSGKYNLATDLDELLTLKILTKGGKSKTLITIPEGKTLKQIAEILEQQGICSKPDLLRQAANESFLFNFGIKAKSAEGYLFPDTYEFEIQSEPEQVLTRMIKRFFSVYNSLLAPKTNLSVALSLHEIVTLASIVEAEAKLDDERPIIASVFLNRLKRKLPLQSCATVEYILKERKPRLSVADLKIESPYNTYLNPGLPPGPICNPGKNSLQAVLAPAKTDYLFFVSRGDGSHQFSKTSQEHQLAIRRYR